ncbi:Hypothetical predicted protein [Lecanosticta acicola]|uniref:Uncharacterized protein n=1 Tax=Lecanosticta acicola TaxID=111012 RepID=A0AAI9EE99_9PEZI|nr:Hypothetical predicted protein [Lecanosticta acicola]
MAGTSGQTDDQAGIFDKQQSLWFVHNTSPSVMRAFTSVVAHLFKVPAKDESLTSPTKDQSRLGNPDKMSQSQVHQKLEEVLAQLVAAQGELDAEKALLAELEAWATELGSAPEAAPIDTSIEENNAGLPLNAMVENIERMPRLTNIVASTTTDLVAAVSKSVSLVLTPLWNSALDASKAIEQRRNALQGPPRLMFEDRVGQTFGLKIQKLEHATIELGNQLSEAQVQEVLVDIGLVLDLIKSIGELASTVVGGAEKVLKDN